MVYELCLHGHLFTLCSFPFSCYAHISCHFPCCVFFPSAVLTVMRDECFCCLKGKCSHGGWFDQTSKINPTGGINKDSPSSSHGHLHAQAAYLAIAATSQLLEDIRGAADDRPFLQYENSSACFSYVVCIHSLSFLPLSLRMMGITRGSGKALCFVIDTTKSMSDELDAVKTVTSTIIDTNAGKLHPCNFQ